MIRYAFFALVVLHSCQNNAEQGFHNRLVYLQADAEIDVSRTSISGLKINWKDGDYIGIFVQSLQSDAPFAFSSGTSFRGYFIRKDVVPSKKEVYSYYPYSRIHDVVNSTIVRAQMPHIQHPPYDSSCDYMVSDVSDVYYDESNMPCLSLSFSNHLFSLLKITVINTEAKFKNLPLYCVHLESKTKTLSGTFSFNVTHGINAKAEFDNSLGDNRKFVDCYFQNENQLGLNTSNTIYALVPPGIYDANDLSVTVYAGDYKTTVTAKKQMNLSTNVLYDLEPIIFSDSAEESEKKTVICFGDSITTGTVTDQLQSLLGNDWKVYIAGVSSETMLRIMVRQGTAPLYVKGGFTIPAYQEKNEFVNVPSGFLTTYHTDGTISSTPDEKISVTLEYYKGNTTYCGHTNPFLVKGVECEIQYNGSNVRLKRLSTGDTVECNEDYVLVKPCAAWKYGTPTVTTVYMGTNGAYSSNQVLANEYVRIKQNVSGGGFIAVGYHHSKWSESYRTTMQNTLGDSYLDLRTEGCDKTKAEYIMSQQGLTLDDDDLYNLDHFIWPASWGGLDTHPTTPIGGRSHAYLIYDKMCKLGYVD